MNAGLPSQDWRLIMHEPTNGPWNMAVDDAILEAVGHHTVPPTLRLYAWDPPCLSLGYAQNISAVDHHRLHNQGWDIVRRPTGGKAILHTDELTYSIIGSYDEPLLKGSLLDSYRAIAQWLLAALEIIGVNACIEPESVTVYPSNLSEQEAICFEIPSKFEITVDHRKLLGSAQARRKEGILQHGTLPLSGDLARISQVLAYPSEADRMLAAERIHKRAVTVEEVLTHQITWQTAAQAFVTSFSEQLGLRLIPADLTPQEFQRAAILLKHKYAHRQWTFKKQK